MALHPDLVGQRVVVRCFVAGEVGPTGGPAFTDVLGILEAWSHDEISVRRKDGETVVIPQHIIATSKPVPLRTSVRQRVPAEALERICAAGWRAPTQEPLGDWLLRAGGGFTGRANSVLVGGDPGRPLEEALAAAEDFYARLDLPVLAQVIVESPWLERLTNLGWIKARPHEEDTVVQVASVAMARRAARARHREPSVEVDVDDVLTRDWVARYGRTAGFDDAVVRAILTSGDAVGFAEVGHPARAIGRGVVTRDWVGLSAVEVDEGSRGRRLGKAIVDALLDWAAPLGAISAYLQTLSNNAAALALYDDYGFSTHHSYRYLRPPRRQTTVPVGS